MTPLRLAAALFVIILPLAPVAGQPPAPIIPRNPQAPTINLPSPGGAIPGSTVEITLTGSNLNDATAILGLPGKVSFPTDANNTKDAAKLRVKVEVPPNTPIGSYPIRVVTRQGVSNARPFCIDDLPVGPVAAGNRSLAAALAMPVPSVASGRIDGETSEYFKITVAAGQRLTIEVLARRIGSALDPILLIHDARSGRELPSLYCDDAPGCQTDARLTHTFREAGEYVIQVRDSTHRGGPEYWYRLRVGDFPSAITPLPLAAKRGAKASIGFAGADLEGVNPVAIEIPADPAVPALAVAPRGSRSHHGWPVSLLLSDLPEMVEQEPNDDSAKANKISVPTGISGQFQQRSDLDHFQFTAKKGQRFLINAQTHELRSPADVYMVLKDAKGGQVAASNPTAGTGIDYTAPADGDFTLVVEHLNYLHGPNEVYYIAIVTPEPDFDIALSVDHIEIPKGGKAVLPIQTLTRRNGFAGPVEVSIVGHPSLTGSTMITAGGPAAPNLPIGLLTITHKGEPASGMIRIQGKATINGKPVIAFADVTAVLRASMSNLPFPSREQASDIAFSTIEPPFTLTTKYAHPEAIKGSPINLTVTAARGMGFTEDVALTVVGLPPNVAAAAKPIAKNTNEIAFPITPAANAPVGTFGVVIIGKGKFQNRDFAVAIPAELTIAAAPFELTAAAVPPLKPGDKAKLKVSAIRKGGYAGAIDLELKNLPAGVTGPKTSIAAGKNEVEIEVTAAANAAPVEKADVNVTGTASGQSAATPPFKVTVVKKP